ncbi:methyltransferase [Aestuariivirga sp.]|uniref:methyltransferase n=1 Tax=Aestuariivirga sp. TaxID=2650926 RepID=UPI003593420A
MGIAGAAFDHWRALRNRLLSSPQFQKFAVSFPLFRPVSRSRSRQLFDLLAGFAYSQILYATVKLGLIDLLKAEPLTAPAIASRLGWNEDRMERLLKAAASLKLLDVTSTGAFTLGIHGAALAGNPWIEKFITHHHLLYEDLTDPIALLKGDAGGTKLKGYWGYAGSDSKDAVGAANAEVYTALMAASQEAVAAEILAAYDFGQNRHLIDVGGSNGTFLAAAAARYPRLKMTLFDLPAVAELGRVKLADAGLGSQVGIAGGSFLTDELPRGPDVATLIRIAHDHDDDSVLRVMQNIRRMLPPDGRLILAEPLSGVPSIAPVADAYFGLYFAAMGQGRTRTLDEISALARQAGFASARALRTRMPLVTGLIQINAS